MTLVPTFVSLYPPIAAATVVNVVMVVVLWRGSLAARREGTDPWWSIGAFLVYGVILGTFLYFRLEAPLTTGLDIFLVALFGEAFGGLVAAAWIGLLTYSRNLPVKQQVINLVFVLMLTAVPIWGVIRGL